MPIKSDYNRLSSTLWDLASSPLPVGTPQGHICETMVSPQAAQSSHSFVRALKAPSDPPQPGGPHKIEMARETWNNTSFYVPNKGEVIVDWLLTKLLKEKNGCVMFRKRFWISRLIDGIRRLSATLDLRYWALFADIISPIDPHVQQTVLLRSSKTWLMPLLNHTPFAPIILAFLSSLRSLSTSDRLSLTPVVLRCMLVVWPLSVPKVTSDTLLECFAVVMKILAEDNSVSGDDSLCKIGDIVTASFRNSFGNASNKKKVRDAYVAIFLF